MRHLFGRYRLLYTSFVRCMKYLNRLQDDALNGRAPTLYSNSNQNDIYPYNKNTSLKAYFAKAGRLARSGRHNGGSRSSSDATLSFTTESGSRGSSEKAAQAGSGTVALGNSAQQVPTRRLGRSMLTDRLLRPTQAGDVDNVNLPWSCAIYSVVNWMVAFADVEGIQVSSGMCFRPQDDSCYSCSMLTLPPFLLLHRLCVSSACHTFSKTKAKERPPNEQALPIAYSERWFCSPIVSSSTPLHFTHLFSSQGHLGATRVCSSTQPWSTHVAYSIMGRATVRMGL